MKDYSLKINGHQYDVTINDVNDESASVVVNGTAYNVEIIGAKSAAPKVQVSAPKPAAASAPAAAAAPRAAAAVGGSGYKVTSPLPGTVTAIKVKEGDTVTVGQSLMTLEAMKMENNIDALKGGVVKSVNVQAGATVMEGDLLMVIE